MKVAIVMGSTSDMAVMEEAQKILTEFEVTNDVKIVSAHRTPEYMYQFAKEAKQNGYDLVIAGAGGSAHLPGMIAALTPLPVIGVPVKSRNLNGIDSMLSIVQMPKGIPVATVAINGSANAALLAISILSISNANLAKKYEDYRQKQTNEVLENV